MFLSIDARNILLQLSEEDLADASLKSKVHHFSTCREINSVIITKDGKLLLSSTRKLHFNAGVTTLQKALGLFRKPIRLNHYDPLPDGFIINFFSNGYDETKVYYTIGEKFTRVYVDLILQRHAEKEHMRMKNQQIFSTDTTKLVADGTISILDVTQVEQGKKTLHRNVREICRNPDLEGPITLVFEKWVTDRTIKRPMKMLGHFPPVEVTLVGRPGETDTKLKHYAIYSKLPGFGKTYQLTRLSERYNVHFVNDPKNWTTVPSSAQILVFDEVGYFHNRLDFENLKALTGGTTAAFTGNCKTYGDSFTPRNDVQVIMLSNRSPYDIYGRWNATLRRRVMTREEMEQFHERFEVFRLDGSAEDDRVQGSTPDSWSEDQFVGECKSIVGKMFVSLSDELSVEVNVSAMITAVDMIVYLCRLRESENIFSVHTHVVTLLAELDEGRFWPSLVETFNACYEGMATKRTGRALALARDRLIRWASIEDALFDSMRIEQLTAYIARRPRSAHGLYRFYANSPRYIDFNCEDKERVFRACISVHGNKVSAEDEYIYRTLVFDRVWTIAQENGISPKKRKMICATLTDQRNMEQFHERFDGSA